MINESTGVGGNNNLIRIIKKPFSDDKYSLKKSNIQHNE